MEYAKIIAITGLPGLYEMLNSKGDGAIVKSLDDQSTRFVSGRVHQFTHLESIEVYTERENVNLVEVLNSMKDSSEKLPDEKDGKALTAYFKKVYPTLDFDRVYASDMKKMVKWFTVLKNNEVELKLSEPPAEEPAEEETDVEATEEASAKPAKKAKAKKEEPEEEPEEEEDEEEDEDEDDEVEAKPKKAAKSKAAAPKKAAAKKEEPKKAPAKKAAAKKAAPKKKKD
jgi:hypothetical protein